MFTNTSIIIIKYVTVHIVEFKVPEIHSPVRVLTAYTVHLSYKL